ncbi:hypothetical protein [Prolixibacter denitrificans]|uniref:Uncharacterized protein n=1 Tax=Prolixibacter denitrificans TaxID=1541063 RepID=A0A2P8CFV7_9BACT|nr:hypothetical protein [Prolixibacter denitrificans]PSK83873.1 hypothetical protein CLV93_103291 [Prolixibacter denitrificans]GET23414.1 hypothetical protein JCM18694_36600 [Prolixibacter denitrificans]
MAQTLITIVIIAIAAYFIIKKAIETIRYFRKPAPCRGCGGSCNTCPITEFPHAGNSKKTTAKPQKKK